MTKWIPIIGLICLLGCESAAGDLKRYTGFLEIAPYTAGKNTRMATVHCADGEQVVVSIVYDERFLEYANKRVVVQGRPAQFPENSRGQAASYFKVSKIELAPGEKPWDPQLTQVPAPPIVTSRKDIDALKGKWGLAVGKPAFEFEPVEPDGSGLVILERIDVTLADGTKLSQWPHRMMGEANVAKHSEADYATILFQTGRDGKLHTQKACLGRVPRCGVED